VRAENSLQGNASTYLGALSIISSPPEAYFLGTSLKAMAIWLPPGSGFFDKASVIRLGALRF